MKHYEVEHQGLLYTVQLHPDTAEALGVEPVTDGTNKKNNVSHETPTPAGESVEGAESEE